VPQLQRVLEQEGGLAAVANMTAFVRGALTQLGLSSFASGNLNISTARALHDATQAFLAGEALGSELSAAQLDRLAALNAAEVYKLSPPPGEHEEGTSYVYRQKVLNPDEENSALVFNLQIGPAGGDGGDDDDSDDESLRSSALLLLSAQLLGEAAFNVLRTQWSLGYMVWAQARQSAAAVGGHAVENFVFIVQNAHDSPRALEARVEDFLQLFHGQHLDALTEEQLTLQRATLATSLAQTRQASLSMTANHAHSWGKIFRALEPHSPPQFDRERRLESILRSDTDRNGVSWSQQLLVFFNQFFLNPATRRKSAMLLFGAAHDPSATAPEPRNMTTTTAGLLERDLELGDIDRRDEMRNATKWGPW
jgi:secreted Zn-dependent insulinase-like peptidase